MARAQSQTGKKEEIDKQLDRYPLTPDKVLYLQIPHKGPPQDLNYYPPKKIPCSSYLILLYKAANCKLLLMHHPGAAT